jgi:hypothetical protein
VRTLGTILLLAAVGCSAPHHDVSITCSDLPVSQSKLVAVTFSTNAWVRSVSAEDIEFVKSALAQPGGCQIDGPIISLGKDTNADGESMTAYTLLRYYDFVRPSGGQWRLLSCGAYNADSF